MNLFQSIVLAIFGLFALTAVIIFSLATGGDEEFGFAGTFKLWGILPAESIRLPLEEFNNKNSKLFRIEYTEKREDTFQNDLVSALAAGVGPDLVILPETYIVQNSDKILPISYDLYPVRDFNDNFIDGARLFMSKEGLFGMPLYVDPLVMYWNKDIFSTGGVATRPTKWDEFENLASRLTISDRSGNISQATVALGSYLNIEHAKDILAALFMQSGNELVRFIKEGEYNSFNLKSPYLVLFGFGNDTDSSESALRFFLDFSNPAKKAYSWNVAMQNSKEAFASGVLGVYFGHASDYGDIYKINPHLNFDIAVLPQREGVKTKITSGNIYSVAVTRGTSNPDIAKQIAVGMSDQAFVGSLSTAINLPPARRDLLSSGTADPVASIFYSSAIISRSWLDPMPSESDQIFQEMTEAVLSGVRTPTQAMRSAGERLGNIIKGQ